VVVGHQEAGADWGSIKVVDKGRREKMPGSWSYESSRTVGCCRPRRLVVNIGGSFEIGVGDLGRIVAVSSYGWGVFAVRMAG